jgi:hypothetical protein
MLCVQVSGYVNCITLLNVKLQLSFPSHKVAAVTRTMSWPLSGLDLMCVWYRSICVSVAKHGRAGSARVINGTCAFFTATFHHLETPRTDLRTHKCPTDVTLVMTFDRQNSTPSNFLKIHLNSILPSTSGFPQLSLSIRRIIMYINQQIHVICIKLRVIYMCGSFVYHISSSPYPFMFFWFFLT